MKSKIVKKKDLDILIESTLKKVGIETKEIMTKSKKKVVEESYFRFDKEGPWMDVNDYSYDELPENDYENIEYNTYDEFTKDYPKHKHFYGSTRPESSSKMFDMYKEKYGPLKGKRLKSFNRNSDVENMGESTSSKKSLMNEDLVKFNKLTNYTYKK